MTFVSDFPGLRLSKVKQNLFLSYFGTINRFSLSIDSLMCTSPESQKATQSGFSIKHYHAEGIPFLPKATCDLTKEKGGQSPPKGNR